MLGNMETASGSTTLKRVEKTSMTSLIDVAQQFKEFNFARELSGSEKLILKWLMKKFTIMKV